MSDVTYGVKVPEELKKQLDDLQKDSGLRTGKDFVQQLVNCYVIEKTKEKIPEVAEELKELQILTQRINNIYLNLGYRIENVTNAQQEKYQSELNKKDSIIYDLQNKLEDVNNDKITLKEDFDKLVNQNKEYLQRVNELTESNDNVKALNEEYKRKNDDLLSIVGEYKQYKAENIKLMKEMDELKSVLGTKDSAINELENSNKQLKDKINNDNEMINFMKEQSESRKEEINNLNKSISEKEAAHKEELKKQEEKFNNEILSYKSEIETFKEEVKELNISISDKEKAHRDDIIELKEECKNSINEKIEQLNSKHELELAKKDIEIEKFKNELEHSKKSSPRASAPKTK